MQHAFIGVDVGTSSTRAEIFDEDGTLLAPAKSPIRIWHEAGDIVEQSSTNDWTTAEPGADSVRACWRAMLERLRADRSTDELRRRLRRLDALVWAMGLLLLAVAAAATSVYWEYAQPS